MADRYGIFRIWILSIISLVLGFNLLILSSNPRLIFMGMIIQAAGLALNQAPRQLVLNACFKAEIRGFACSLAYNLSTLIGSFSPFIALYFLDFFQTNHLLGLYLLLLGFMSIFSMRALKSRIYIKHDPTPGFLKRQ